MVITGVGCRQSRPPSVQHLERESGHSGRDRAEHAGVPTTPSIPNLSDVNYFNTAGLSNYYALQVSVNKRCAKG